MDDHLSVIWDTISPKLFGYLVNSVGSKETAEDIFQTVWIRAVEGLPNYRDRGKPFSAWIFAIARNECLQYWRKQKRETPFDPGKHDIADRQSSIEEKMFADQIVSALSEDDQEILRLRYIADMSLKDIALVLKLNFVAVRVRVHRALARARASAALIYPYEQ